MGLTSCMANYSIMNNILVFPCISFQWCMAKYFPFLPKRHCSCFMLDEACRSFPALLYVLQSWHSHVPLKENWPCCTAFLTESQSPVFSWSAHWKWTQTIHQYPTAFRKRDVLQEQNFVGLLAFPLTIHLALCVVWERWVVSTSTWIMVKYWTAAMPALGQFPGRSVAGWALSSAAPAAAE